MGPADNNLMKTFTSRWPWKTQEKLTLLFLPALAAIPTIVTLSNGRPVTVFKASLLGVAVLWAVILWRLGTSRKVKSEIVATLEGDILTVRSLRHGETTGDLSQAGEMRTYRHAITLENVLSIRTSSGDLRIPVRLLTGNPDLAAAVVDRTGQHAAVEKAVRGGAL